MPTKRHVTMTTEYKVRPSSLTMSDRGKILPCTTSMQSNELFARPTKGRALEIHSTNVGQETSNTPPSSATGSTMTPKSINEYISTSINTAALSTDTLFSKKITSLIAESNFTNVSLTILDNMNSKTETKMKPALMAYNQTSELKANLNVDGPTGSSMLIPVVATAGYITNFTSNMILNTLPKISTRLPLTLELPDQLPQITTVMHPNDTTISSNMAPALATTRNITNVTAKVLDSSFSNLLTKMTSQLTAHKPRFKSTTDIQASNMDRSPKIRSVVVKNISTTRMTTGSNVGLFQSMKDEVHSRTSTQPILRRIPTTHTSSVKILDFEFTSSPAMDVTTPTNGLIDDLSMSPTKAWRASHGSTAQLSTSIISNISPKGSRALSVKNETTTNHHTIQSNTTPRQYFRPIYVTNIIYHHKRITNAANMNTTLTPGT